jgi:predicted dinucleotide-utilizing enzyme
MTLEQGPRNIEKVMVSSLDLNQVRDAVREVRASHPSSILADLVEEKICALESASHHFVSGFFEDFRISRPLNS